MADDFSAYDADIDGENVAEKTAGWFVEIIRYAAGIAPTNALMQQKQQQIAIDVGIVFTK